MLTPRGWRKFTSGALEEGAQILGSTAASVLVVGLVGPYIAALSGRMPGASSTLIAVAVVALLVAFITAIAAMTLRGLARIASDDAALDPAEPGS